MREGPLLPVPLRPVVHSPRNKAANVKLCWAIFSSPSDDAFVDRSGFSGNAIVVWRSLTCLVVLAEQPSLSLVMFVVVKICRNE